MNRKPPSTPKSFERSKRDVEPRSMKEGSAREEAYDRRQAKPAGKVPAARSKRAC